MSETKIVTDEYQTALAKISALETENKQLKDQLNESTEAFKIIKKQFDAAETTEKSAVIDELVKDSFGKLTKESLKDHSLKELYFLKDNLDRAAPKSFVSVMRQREQDEKKPAPLGTIGSYNQETGKYEGGL
jgi:cell division septum initiation protein DivIVA